MSDSAVKRVIEMVGATAGVLVAGTAAGVLTQRKGLPRRRTGAEAPLGSVRGERHAVTTADGLTLYAEVDEPAVTPLPGSATIVFVHGYALNLDCWHFQRLALRGEHRLVLYDQRSHGRSDRSQPEHCRIDMLGEDLREVVEQLAPDGPVVLVGHSMGGMTVLALAQLHPEWFGGRVAGVVLLSTCADGMGDVTFGLPRGMARVLHDVSPSMLLALARAPKLVERGRRMGAGYAFAITQRLAFGGRVPREYVHFTDEMLSSTPVDVLACFYPEFARLDKAQVLLAEDWPPTTIVCGSRDLFTPVRLSRQMADAVPSSRLVEIPDAGHLLMLERADQVNEEIARLLQNVPSR